MAKLGSTDVYGDLKVTGAVDAAVSTQTQTALDLKVDIADIVNDLTTGGTTVPLSAEQGKTLKTSVDAKQATLVSGTNIKTVNSTSLVGSGNVAVGTVTSVAASVPTGLSVAGSPVTTTGTLAITYTSGYSIPTNTKQSQWDTAYGWGNHASVGYILTSAIGSTVQGYSAVLSGTTASFTTTLLTKLNGIESNADVTDATNVNAAGAVMNSDTTTTSMSFVVDEDDMVSNSATKVPTQQSVKAYVDDRHFGKLLTYSDTDLEGLPDGIYRMATGGSNLNTTFVLHHEGLSFQGKWSATDFKVAGITAGRPVPTVSFRSSFSASGDNTYEWTDWLELWGTHNLPLLDEDDMASNSATSVPTQQSVKAYVDANLTGMVLTNSTDTLTNKTITNLVFDGDYKEEIYSLTGTALDPTNGTIQTKTLSGNTTFTDSLVNGQSMTLRLAAGASYVVTWPTTTWVSTDGNVAPELTAGDIIVFWKEGTTLFAKYSGSYV